MGNHGGDGENFGEQDRYAAVCPYEESPGRSV